MKEISEYIKELLRIKKILRWKASRTKDNKKYKDYCIVIRGCEKALHEFDKGSK